MPILFVVALSPMRMPNGSVVTERWDDKEYGKSSLPAKMRGVKELNAGFDK
jgi:hypothetical protein